MSVPYFPTQIEPFYATYVRPSDGAVVTNRGQVIGPPLWVRFVLEDIHERLDFSGIPRKEWDWPKVPECAR